MIYDYIIIGAGLTSLHLAKRLKEQNQTCLIFEKSRNIGGRMANRRIDDLSFEKGAESIKAYSKPLRNILIKAERDKFLYQKNDAFYPVKNFNFWIKSLAKGLEIKLKEEVLRFQIVKNLILINQKYYAHNLIITAPAPQAYELLKRSSLNLFELQNVKYTKDIFIYLKTSTPIDSKSNQFLLKNYIKRNNNHYYALSLKEWRDDDKFLLEKEYKDFFNAHDIHVHKWRYSKVKKMIHPRYQVSLRDKNIYLAGDYFFGDGFNHCIQSANYLNSFLQTKG